MAAKAAFSVSNCFAFIVVLGPRRFPLGPSSSSLPYDSFVLPSTSSEAGDPSEMIHKKATG